MVSRHDTKPDMKVIEFGVAKGVGQALTDKTRHRRRTDDRDTAHMSPRTGGHERPWTVDTGAIYSIGVLLYESVDRHDAVHERAFKRASVRRDPPPGPSFFL